MPVCWGTLRPSIFSSSGRLLSPARVSLKSSSAPREGESKPGESVSGTVSPAGIATSAR